MKLRFNAQHDLDQEDLSLLFSNIPNEVLNGFKLERFEERIGSTEDEFRKMAKRWLSNSNLKFPFLEVSEMKVFRNALALTLLELGDDEFQTRTGCAFGKGTFFLQALDRYIAAGAHS